ncbi:MAG TPA: DUF1772 domain-containing protein [Terracidiphilus sp.]
MEHILDIAATLCIGLLIGTEFAVSAFINPVLEKLELSARVDATRRFARKLGTVMPFWYSFSLLLLVAESVILRHGPALPFLVAASAIWVAVIILTLLFLVPINNRIVQMDPASFVDSLRHQHQKWDTLHRWRVLALCVAMTCMLIGIRL